MQNVIRIHNSVMYLLTLKKKKCEMVVKFRKVSLSDFVLLRRLVFFP